MQKKFQLWPVYAFVFLSGFSALIYQIIWQKYLETFVGSHALATTLVLAVFFGALSLGSFFIGRYAKKFQNQIIVYSILEGLIGFYAILSVDWFQWTSQLFLKLPFFYHYPLGSGLILAFLLLGFPVFLMGGTIPVVTQGLSQDFEGSEKIHARVYSLNTFGAFLGAVLTGLYFVEIWGLPLTLYHAAFLNLAVALAGLIYTKKSKYPFSGPKPTREKKSQLSQEFLLFATLAFLSGFVFFLIEGLIVRMAGLSIGSSTYTYSMVVGAFIFSIAFGSFLVTRKTLFQKIENYYFLLFFLSISLFLSVNYWPDLFWRVRIIFTPSILNFNAFWITVCSILILILFLPIGVLGMNLPLLFGFFKSKTEHLNQFAGKMYSINAIGSVLGALASFIFLEYFSSTLAFKTGLILIGIQFLIAMSLLKRITPLKTLISLGSIIIIFLLPGWNAAEFVPGKYLNQLASNTVRTFSENKKIIEKNKPELIFQRDDSNTFVAVGKDSSGLSLYVNGKADVNTTSDAAVRSLNALIPITIRKNPEEVFIIGLGGGLSASLIGNLESVKKIEISEISTGVIEAQKYFDPFNYQIEKAKPKYELYRGDAYQILKSKPKKYDLIISEPSNPWVTGVEKLFTEEFLKEISSHLNPNSIYGQWFPLFMMTNHTLEAILSNFSKAFAYNTLWSTFGGALLILSSNEPIQLDYDYFSERFNQYDIVFKRHGIIHPYVLLSHQILGPESFKALAELNPQTHTLDNPSLQFEANRAFFARMSIDINLFISNGFNALKHFEGYENQLLYEGLWKKTPEEFYTKNLIDANIDHIPPFSKRRIGIQYALQHSNYKLTNPPKEVIEEIKAIILGNEKHFQNKEYSIKNASELVLTYQNIISSQLPVRIKNFPALLKVKCVSAEECEKWKEFLKTL